MKKLTTNNLIPILIGLVFLSMSVFAQNFTNNTGGTYTAGACSAVIKMKSTTGQFDGSAQLGTSATNRIQGIVDWAATANGQTVQGLYYTNLFVSGGQKTIADGVYVSGTGCSSPLPGYTQLTNGVGYWATSGNRTYNGTFNYDGTSAQVIFPENGGSGNTNRYKDLNLTGGAKSNNGIVEVNEELTSATGADLTVANNFTVYGTGTSTLAGGVTVNGTNTTTLAFVGNNATVNTSGTVTVTTGVLDISTSGGTFNVNGTLALGNGDATSGGRLNLGANATLNIANTFTNSDANHDNMIFAANSTVSYTQATGTQQIVFTNDDNPQHNYGNLTFSGGATKQATGDVHTRGNVSIAGGPIEMGTNCGLTGNTFFANATGGNKITYSANDNSEYIRGNLRYRGTFSTGTAYTFNNAQTQITFSAAPQSYFQLNVQPATQPQNNGGFNAANDVTRCVTIDYDGTTGNISTLRVGYTSGDLIGFTANETNLRFEEAWGTNASDRHKITGGAGTATNSGATNPRFVQLVTNPTLGLKLNAPTGGGTTYELAKGSNIILTASPLQYIAVNPGRWTNPNTWDEGAIPPSNANTLIRTTVYAGIAGPAYGTPATGNTTTEFSVYGSNPIAHSITIDNGTTYPDAALIIGNEDNGDGYVIQTAMSGTVGGMAAGFYNNNAVANTVGGNPDNDTWNTKSTDPTGTGNSINGLFISNIKNTGYTNPPTFATGQITNAGTIVNYSIIELGQ